MADIPYLMSVTNLTAILDRIREAGTPPKFTYEFLKSSLGFGSSNDRGVIKVLKQLGFLTSDSTPTGRYNQFRSGSTSGAALAAGLRDGWADVFLADQKAHEKTVSELTGLFKAVTGKGESVAQKMASTFKTLAGKADWNQSLDEATGEDTETEDAPESPGKARGRMTLHQDVHIHLPPTSDVAVYTAIFRALRDELLD